MNNLNNLNIVSNLPICNTNKIINCLKQSCSLYIFFVIIYLMDSRVNTIFYISAWCNSITAFIFHANQQPCLEKYYCNILGRQFGPFHGSYNAYWNNNTVLFKVLYHMDLFFICFFLLYTGLYDITNRFYLSIFLSYIGSFYTFNHTIMMMSFALSAIIYRTILMVYMNILPLYELIIFVSASILGCSILFLGPLDRWYSPHRFVWHICCALILRLCGLINV